jgi:RNA 3'-terminal phosphate cyclase-like protein
VRTKKKEECLLTRQETLFDITSMSTTVAKKKVKTFEGHDMFRYRLVTAVLSGQPIRIQNIRADAASPGVTDAESSFLGLIEELTNGSAIQINETGTSVIFRPGILVGGGPIEYTCKGNRGISWFLEALACLLPFTKKKTIVILRGITNDHLDQTVDAIRTVTLPMLHRFGIQEGLELKILKRGAPPLGGGEVRFTCHPVRVLTPVNLVDEGRIKRVRGIAYSTRVSPQMSNRVVESARGLLNSFLPDVYIYTDHYKGEDSGLSPGYGLCLVAESTTGVNLAAEVMGGKDTTPEDLGVHAAKLLCSQIKIGGCVDASNQPILLMLMALTPEDVSHARVGKLSQYSIELLRLIYEMFGVKFKIKPDQGTVMLSCLGVGFSNIAKAIC